MNYQDLLNGIKKYGSSERGICFSCLGVFPEQINRDVILAPWWEPRTLPSLGNAVYLKKAYEKDAVKIWNIENNGFNMTYIKTGIGAPVLMDAVLALGLTPCERLIFIGSVGSLDQNISIGDIVIPEYSICGDGASRYISFDLLKGEDAFGSRAYPDKTLKASLMSAADGICSAKNVRLHVGRTFSVDTIFAQYAHIGEILEMGCNTIEMETASAFRAAESAGISVAAIFSVSDNTVTDKSLMSGITEQEKAYRRQVRGEVIPEIILKIFESRREE